MRSVISYGWAIHTASVVQSPSHPFTRRQGHSLRWQQLCESQVTSRKHEVGDKRRRFHYIRPKYSLSFLWSSHQFLGWHQSRYPPSLTAMLVAYLSDQDTWHELKAMWLVLHTIPTVRNRHRLLILEIGPQESTAPELRHKHSTKAQQEEELLSCKPLMVISQGCFP